VVPMEHGLVSTINVNHAENFGEECPRYMYISQGQGDQNSPMDEWSSSNLRWNGYLVESVHGPLRIAIISCEVEEYTSPPILSWLYVEGGRTSSSIGSGSGLSLAVL
jgi:hypothetical protein